MLARVVRWIVIIVAGIVLVAVGVAGVARFSDGPIFVFPGGPLQAGELASLAETDWEALRGVEEIELQLLEPPQSRTTWLVVLDGSPYVPCGFCDNQLLKHWPRHLETDDRVLLRVVGKRYEGRLARVEDRDSWTRLKATLSAKYRAYQEAHPDQLWFYRLEPRDSEGG